MMTTFRCLQVKGGPSPGELPLPLTSRWPVSVTVAGSYNQLQRYPDSGPLADLATLPMDVVTLGIMFCRMTAYDKHNVLCGLSLYSILHVGHSTA
jgi:hypothetical protein